jgi:hypothetical protein
MYGGEWIYYEPTSTGYQLLSECQNIFMETGLVRVAECMDGVAIEKPYSYLLHFHNMQSLAKNKKVRQCRLINSLINSIAGVGESGIIILQTR